ncbi:MAG TPA: dihydropyrimidine dehydrogenase, partial [Proteobacteria bacterium]|nr:dihydropyrimidine dehydrogenase [Pseudomonadota bacterium]
MRQLNDQTGTIYEPAQAVFEATRCIECYNAPCVDACPVGVDIPRFIGRIKMGDFIGADQIIREKCLLPGVCGLICPVERLCVESCCVTQPLGPVRIHQLQRFAAASALAQGNEEFEPVRSSGQKVGIVGSGPAGLAAAASLVNKGYWVTVFEAMDSPGGMMTYSIPDHRLPRNILEAEIDAIKKRGVEIRTGSRVDPGELLEQDFSAVFLGIGTHKPVSTGIPGCDLTGVYQGLDFLRLVSAGSAADPLREEIAGRRVAVVGGGDVAMDAAISAARLGAKRTHLLYRRSYQEMPAIESEVSLAQQEGVLFWILTNPTRIIGDEQGRVTS